MLVLAFAILAVLGFYSKRYFNNEIAHSMAETQLNTAAIDKATPINNSYSVDKKTGSVTIVIPR